MQRDFLKKEVLRQFPEAVQSSVSISNIERHPFEANIVQSFNFRFLERDYIIEIIGNRRSTKLVYNKVVGSYNPKTEWVRN